MSKNNELKTHINLIAESLGIKQLDDHLLTMLSSEVEMRTREIIEDSSNIMRHCNRNILKEKDIKLAIKSANFDPPKGYLPRLEEYNSGLNSIKYDRCPKNKKLWSIRQQVIS